MKNSSPPGLFAGVLAAVFVISSTYLYLKDVSHVAAATKLSEQLDTLRTTHSEQLQLHASQRTSLEQQVRDLGESFKSLKKDAEEKQLAEKDARVLAVGAAEAERGELRKLITKVS
eukprot:5982364-Prymnesium_polylepis.1